MEVESSLTQIKVLVNGGLLTLLVVNIGSLMLESETEETAVE